jgi:hypothetical protein
VRDDINAKSVNIFSPNFMKKSALYASAVVVLSTLFVVSSRLHMAVDEAPVGTPMAGGESLIDIGASGAVLAGPFVAASDGGFFSFFKYASGDNSIWFARKTDASGTFGSGGALKRRYRRHFGRERRRVRLVRQRRDGDPRQAA